MAAFHTNLTRTAAGGRRDPKDRYETPDEVVEAVVGPDGPLRNDFSGWRVVDPCCGTGRVVRCLRRLSFRSAGTDIDEDGLDFLSSAYAKSRGREAACLTNPPFRHAREFVERALGVFDGPVAMLLPADFVASQGRRDWLSGPGRPHRQIIIPWRIRFLKRNGEPISGQAYSHQWLLWGEGRRRAQCTLTDWAPMSDERRRRAGL